MMQVIPSNLLAGHRRLDRGHAPRRQVGIVGYCWGALRLFRRRSSCRCPRGRVLRRRHRQEPRRAAEEADDVPLRRARRHIPMSDVEAIRPGIPAPSSTPTRRPRLRLRRAARTRPGERRAGARAHALAGLRRARRLTPPAQRSHPRPAPTIEHTGIRHEPDFPPRRCAAAPAALRRRPVDRRRPAHQTVVNPARGASSAPLPSRCQRDAARDRRRRIAAFPWPGRRSREGAQRRSCASGST